MFKFLVQIILVIAASLLALGFFISDYSSRIASYIDGDVYYQYAYAPTLRLTEKRLRKIPINARDAFLQQHSADLGVITELKPLSFFTEAEQASLREGEEVYNYGTDYVGIKLPDENRVVYLNVLDSPQHYQVPDDVEMVVATNFFYLQQSLKEKPVKAWQDLIAQTNATHPDQLLAIVESAELPKALKTIDLKNGRTLLKTAPIETIADLDIADYYYQKIDQPTAQEYYLRMGPIRTNIERFTYTRFVLYSFASGILLLVPIMLWLLPTWWTLRRLSTATNAFAKGNLDARARPVFGSNLKQLSLRFNYMADSIQRLFNSHKMMTMAVSHDLRTPLSRLEFAMEMLRKSPENSETQLARMETAVDELSALVSEILLHASLDRDHSEFEFEQFDGKTWLNHEMQQWQYSRPQLSIQWRYEGDRMLRGNAYYLSRALLNLVDNACQFAHASILVEAESHDNRYVIRVLDDGKGIDNADIEKIFQPFERLDKSRNRQSGGTGLGLAIVKLVAEKHHGNITAHNRHEQNSQQSGAVFTLTWGQ